MAINFPDTSASPWYNDPASGGNGVTYVYTSGGYWTAVQVTGSNAIDQTTGDARYVNVSGDNMTGNLTLGTTQVSLNASNGSATFAGDVLAGLTSAVGISGTPADLNSTEIGRGYINLSRDDTQAADHIQFGKNGSVAGSIGTSTTNSLTFKTGTTERLRIDSSGSATFSGYVDFMRNAGDGFGYLGIGPGGTNEKATFVNRSGEIDFELYSNYTSSATVSINSEGSAMFAGNVGVGTASADANLHIKGGYPTVHIERDHATNYSRLLLDNTANDGGAIDGIGDGVGGLRFSTSDAGTITERMRLDTSGLLNIGTTSGNAGRPVHIHTAGSGSSYFHSTNDGTGATASDGIVMGMGAAADAYIWNYESGMIQFGTNGGARMTIEGSGFVKAQAGYLYVQTPSVSGTGNADGVALIVDGNADAYLWNYENTTLRFGTNNTEAMRVDNGGNVGIGVTSPQQPLHLKGAYFRIDDASQSLGTMYLGAENGQNSIYSQGANGAATAQPLRFMLGGGTETMRIDSNSDVHIGKTAFTSHNTNGTTLANGGWAHHCAANIAALYLNRNNSNGNIAEFYVSNSYIGNINYNGTTCTFNNVSDYRLKENVVDIADGIARVKQLSPRRFNFISNPDATVDGFIAHEAQAVVPQAVCGEKDGEQMQGIDQSQLVPLLTAALQEAIAKIETLETRVAALEAG